MRSLQITVWPADGLEEFQVYELEVDVGWWTLNQRVHRDDIVACMHDAIDAWHRNANPTP